MCVRTDLQLWNYKVIPSQLARLAALPGLPHLDRSNSHATVLALAPGRQPLGGSIPKGPLRVCTCVNPGLIAHMIPKTAWSVHVASLGWRISSDDLQEPPILGADCNVENQVELLVEGCIAGRRV